MTVFKVSEVSITIYSTAQETLIGTELEHILLPGIPCKLLYARTWIPATWPWSNWNWQKWKKFISPRFNDLRRISSTRRITIFNDHHRRQKKANLFYLFRSQLNMFQSYHARRRRPYSRYTFRVLLYSEYLLCGYLCKPCSSVSAIREALFVICEPVIRKLRPLKHHFSASCFLNRYVTQPIFTLPGAPPPNIAKFFNKLARPHDHIMLLASLGWLISVFTLPGVVVNYYWAYSGRYRYGMHF